MMKHCTKLASLAKPVQESNRVIQCISSKPRKDSDIDLKVCRRVTRTKWIINSKQNQKELYCFRAYKQLVCHMLPVHSTETTIKHGQ